MDDLAEYLNQVSESSKDEKVISRADYGIQTLMHVQLVFYAREVELEKGLKVNMPSPPLEVKEPTKG